MSGTGPPPGDVPPIVRAFMQHKIMADWTNETVDCSCGWIGDEQTDWRDAPEKRWQAHFRNELETAMTR